MTRRNNEIKSFRKFAKLIALGIIVFNSTTCIALPKNNDEVKHTRYLFIDSRIIKNTENVKLTNGTLEKSEQNPLFAEDKSWEARYDNLYANVLYDEQEDLYKCWYSPFIIDPASNFMPREKRIPGTYNKVRRAVKNNGKKREMGVCYATSKDGIKWEKPELGIVEFDGSKKNNLVIRGPHGAGVFKDLQESDPEKRYKMFFKEKIMSVAFSPDGLHWSEPVQCPEIDAAGDTHNNVLWVSESGEYVGITRLWDRERHIRQIGRTMSKDFLNWTKAKVILEGIQPHLQVYAMPTFRYANIYVGLPVIFNAQTDRSHTELAWSSDSVHWYRINPGIPFIGTSNVKGDYDWGCVYAGAYPVFEENEIRLYYGASNGQHTDWRDGFFCLATLRPDGFAGYEQEFENVPGIITTKPIVCAGKELQLCADVRRNGFIKVQVLNKDNNEVLAESKPIKQTITDAEVEWQKGFSIRNLKGKIILLKFELMDAKLYSFSFDIN